MHWLADTNILLRLMHRTDPQHTLVRAAVRLLGSRGDLIFYAPQNLVELWRLHAPGAGERPGIINL